MEQDKKVLNRHIASYLKVPESSSEHRGLNRVEELYFGQKGHLAYISAKLWENGKPIEAKGIQIRNNLELLDFEDSNKAQWIIGSKYEPEQDFIPEQDYFDAAGFNFEEKLSIPEDHEVEIIESEDELKLLKVMLN